MSARDRGPGWRCRTAPLLVAIPVLAGLRVLSAGNTMPPRRHVVEIRGMAFQPAVLEVEPGDTVVWINRDIVPHTATTAGSHGWDTGSLAQGQSGSYLPRRGGVMSYICKLHPTMQGRLIIRKPAPAPQ